MNDKPLRKNCDEDAERYDLGHLTGLEAER